MMTGTPRNTSVYTAPNIRSGNSAGLRAVAAHRDDQAPHQDARRAPQEQLDVDPQVAEQFGERLGELLAVEEAPADLVPIPASSGTSTTSSADDHRRC